MGKPTDIRVVSTRLEIEPLPFRAPLKFGGRIMDHADLVHVWVRVVDRHGREGTGFGSMPLGNVWAWPSATLEPADTARAMKLLASEITTSAESLGTFGHPLQLIRELHRGYDLLAERSADGCNISERIPKLAILVAASAIDAALHDAHGRLLDKNSFQCLSKDFIDEDLSNFLTPDFAGEYLDQYTLATPKPTMPLYHLVGALDPLAQNDLSAKINDGLPETLEEWIPYNGLTHLKIKLNGDDLAWDVARVIAVNKIAEFEQAKRGCTDWHYSLDFNERCQNVDYVLEFLDQVSTQSADALRRVQYIEQPTHRDLKSHPENRMEKAAKIKPVVIDESLVDLESFFLAREQGYSGIALKACKGHSEALLMGALAQKFGMFLCVQDLTCPGASFLHSAALSARIPGVAAIEGNGRQYCPAGNRFWEDKFPAMFHVSDGQLGTSCLTQPGIGHSGDVF